MILDTATPDQPKRRGPSRRTLLAGGLGVVVLAAVGVPVTEKLTEGDNGLVTRLLAKKPFYIAHRGGSADWPEFSLEGYRQSVAAGIDALEISLARSADGVWFGLHDATLDRTSGTKNFIAAEHDWAEIRKYTISAAGTTDGWTTPQPYLRFDDLVTAYARTHTIFVDPKAADSRYYPELLQIMDQAVPDPNESFVAKYYCTGTNWADAARARGYKSWGFYYGADLDDGATPLAATQAKWDILGLDVAASAADWESVRSYGKPVIGHIIADKSQALKVRQEGASGLMVSGVLEVLGSKI